VSVRRILLVITDLEIGGTPTVVRELATRLNQIPHVKCEVACLKELGPVGHQLRAGQVKVHAFGARGWWNALGTMTQLIDLVRFGLFDTVISFLVHANAMSAAASVFFKRERQGGVRWIQSIQTTQPSPHWHWRLQRRIRNRAECFVVPSQSVAQVAHQLADIPLERFRVISNAIEPQRFEIERKRLPGFNVGFIGRLDPIKRIPDLLHAIKLLGDEGVSLHVFGAGAEREHITSEIGRLSIGDRVTMHGAVQRPQDALEAIDLLVLPSSAEGFGLVLIEAMAAGIPVIGTNAPGIRDVVRHGETGLLVPVGSPQELADAIRRVKDDSALRHRLVARALEDVHERFTWQAVLEQYADLLQIEDTAPPVVG
jgi:glycosyltransferase involved in cell wall biosynthesis